MSFMPSVANEPFILSVVMLSVIILNVVAPLLVTNALAYCIQVLITTVDVFMLYAPVITLGNRNRHKKVVMMRSNHKSSSNHGPK